MTWPDPNICYFAWQLAMMYTKQTSVGGRQDRQCEPPRSFGSVPCDLDETTCTPAYLSQLLQKRVVQCSAQRLDGGMSGSGLFRIHVVGENLPKSVIMKFSNDVDAPEGLSPANKVELACYKVLGPAARTMGTFLPRLYGCDAVESKDMRLYTGEGQIGFRSVLMLEDMKLHSNCFIYSTLLEPVAAEHFKMQVVALARLHGAFWNSPLLNQLHPNTLGLPPWWEDRRQEEMGTRMTYKLRQEVLQNVHIVDINAIANKYQGRQFDTIKPGQSWVSADWIVTCKWLKEGYSDCVAPHLEGMLHSGQTWLHGDCHHANMFFTGSQVYIADWQFSAVGHPCLDLAYMSELSASGDSIDFLSDYYREFVAASGASCRELPYNKFVEWFALCVLHMLMHLLIHYSETLDDAAEAGQYNGVHTDELRQRARTGDKEAHETILWEDGDDASMTGTRSWDERIHHNLMSLCTLFRQRWPQYDFCT